MIRKLFVLAVFSSLMISCGLAPRTRSVEPFFVNFPGDHHGAYCTTFAIAEKLWITAAHCVPTNATFTIGTIDTPATVIIVDTNLDLAAVRSEHKGQAVKISRIRQPRQRVYVVGFTKGPQELHFTQYVVASQYLHKKDPVPIALFEYGVWFGISGAPVFDERGRVVSVIQGGIEEAKVEVSYGVTSDNLKSFVERAIKAAQ